MGAVRARVAATLAGVVLLVSSSPACVVASGCSQGPLAMHHVPGRVHIAGLFAAHSGVNCSMLESEGFQQATSAISVVQTLRQVNYTPGITIGLSVYDTCSSADVAHKALVNAMVQAECLRATSLGLVGAPSVAESVSTLAAGLRAPVTRLATALDPPLLTRLAGDLVTALASWPRVDWLLADAPDRLADAVADLSRRRICVHHHALLKDLAEVPEGVVVVIARWADLEHSLRVSPSAHLLVVSLDGDVNFKSDRLPVDTFALVPSLVELPGADNASDHHLMEPVQAPVFVQVAADILQVLNLFKATLAEYCPPGTVCDELKPLREPALTRPVMQSPRLVTYILNVLQVESEQFDGFTVFHKVPDEVEFYEHFGSFKIIDDRWTFVSEVENETTATAVCRPTPDGNSTGLDCTYCSNFDDIYRHHFEELRERETLRNMVEWRSESWVAAIASISAVGVLCCLAIGVFILVRICKRDVLEGNPSFTFLLLLSIIFTYASILPFSFQVVDDHHFFKGLLCTARLFGTSLSYALLFSIMLARSLMLASCDRDGGFMSHVNGYHQTVLCFFIAAVQIGLSVQFWAVNWRFLPEDQCSTMTDGYLFILSLCYDMFLLLLLVFITPFIIRSKRNYHEGGYFAVGSILCLIIWVSWVTGYILLPGEFNDIFVVSGLCGTASVLLVTVFIPRTYLMMTGIVRDHLASALPSLAYQSSTSIVDVNYRSTQALYDSVNPVGVSRGQSNPNFYAERPTTPSTSKMDTVPRIMTTAPPPDNTYERYGTPPSPLNVTRF